MTFVSITINTHTASSGVADGFTARTINTSMTMTNRMRQIAAAISLGRTNKEMADDLNISMKTIEKHRQLLMKTFSLRNTADITRFSIMNRIIQHDKTNRWIMQYNREYYPKSRKALKALAPKLQDGINLNESK